jgi:hypothetical protein
MTMATKMSDYITGLAVRAFQGVDEQKLELRLRVTAQRRLSPRTASNKLTSEASIVRSTVGIALINALLADANSTDPDVATWDSARDQLSFLLRAADVKTA